MAKAKQDHDRPRVLGQEQQQTLAALTGEPLGGDALSDPAA